MLKNLSVKAKNFFVYIISLLFVSVITLRRRTENPNTLLLVQLNAIGDYILFRNFIEELKNSSKYKDCKITLCGNIIWKELAENFDKQKMHDFIWVDRKEYNKNLLYRYKILRSIYSRGFEIAINPTYSREILYDDLIIKASSAKERIGSEGALEKHAYWKRKLLTDSIYTSLIKTTKENLFEFTRNKMFFEKLLETNLVIKKPYILSDLAGCKLDLKEKYVVLFPGAGITYRRWNLSNFMEIARFIIEEYSINVIIAGVVHEAEINLELLKDIDKRFFHNFLGKTTLLQLTALIRDSELFISNETGAVHIAVALDKKVICISNGNHLGRFNPYPKEIFSEAHYIYPKEINNRSINNETYRFLSELDINSIHVDKVKNKIKEVF